MKKINLKIKEQKKNECAVECLTAVLKYFGEKNIKRGELIKEIGKLNWKWRNWDYEISLPALVRGFKVTVITQATHVFDPTWFKISKKTLINKLQKEAESLEKEIARKRRSEEYYFWESPNYEIHEAKAALDFLKKDGDIKFQPITKKIIEAYINKNIPIFFPHNATLLNSKSRILKSKKNDIMGHHWGHVALITGYDKKNFYITDPNKKYTGKYYYSKNKDLVVESIVRFDQNIYVIHK